jgi:hypothetical protein
LNTKIELTRVIWKWVVKQQVLEVGEGGDDEDYEREDPPPSDIDGCDWDVLSPSFMT